jgi:hypothetical protein
MIRKSGSRFSEKVMLKQENIAGKIVVKPNRAPEQAPD